jgi:ribose 5-phosphate isomerase RpiB
MRVGIASDHGGFALKEQIAELLRGAGHEVVDADWRSAAAEWEHPSPQTRLPVCVPDLYTTYSPPTRALKTTT